MPCPYALALSRVPRRKWATRAELLERIELTRKLIQDAPAQDLTIAGLAKVAAISESHYIRLFHATYGSSPIKMLADRRMTLAAQLLCQGCAVQDVAVEVGYASVPTFCRQFKIKFKATPSEYRRAQNLS